jgi:sporulation protein YhbH
MPLPIEQDAQRFRQIVRGKIKQNLRKYISNGELIGRKGKELVSIPIPQIQLPYFRFGGKTKGVGQGDGEVGTPIGRDGQPGSGSNGAGNQPGAHILEVELTIEEMAEILGEELELPRIQPKSKNNVEGTITRYTGMRRVGPEGLRYFKRTYREALKRQLASGTYDILNPVIVPIRDDKRYRSWKEYPKPDSNAVVIYMMDVSGSMSDRKKELVRLTAFWIDTWLQAQYKNIITRYIVHDAKAYEVDANTFYTLRESGGTKISSAYELCSKLIQKEFDPGAWNLYAFHFSDGENYDGEDDRRCINLLEESLLPDVNLFCYGQVRSYQGKQFIDTLKNIEDDKLTSAKINDDEDIYSAIKVFLGKGF